MDSINANAASLVQKMAQEIKGTNFNQTVHKTNNQIVNDTACEFHHAMFENISKFDMTMNNITLFKDIISTAQGGISEMKKHGESIRDLVARAKEEGITPEIMDKMQAEVDSRVAEINRIKNETNFNGINPFNGVFSLDIPDVLELMGAQDKEEADNAISEILGTFDIDISIEGDGFSIGGSAKIEIGYTDDGALQINVDASMDYDLSGLVGKGGITSEGAFDLINNFINMLGVQQGDLSNAQNFLNAIFEQIFNAVNGGKQDLPDGLEVEPDSSNSLKGKMVQQASITLDGMAGQAPDIAINIL